MWQHIYDDVNILSGLPRPVVCLLTIDFPLVVWGGDVGDGHRRVRYPLSGNLPLERDEAGRLSVSAGQIILDCNHFFPLDEVMWCDGAGGVMEAACGSGVCEGGTMQSGAEARRQSDGGRVRSGVVEGWAAADPASGSVAPVDVGIGKGGAMATPSLVLGEDADELRVLSGEVGGVAACPAAVAVASVDAGFGKGEAMATASSVLGKASEAVGSAGGSRRKRERSELLLGCGVAAKVLRGSGGWSEGGVSGRRREDAEHPD